MSSLKLEALLEKARTKGITPKPIQTVPTFNRPWQQESALYKLDNETGNESGNKLGNTPDQSGNESGNTGNRSGNIGNKIENKSGDELDNELGNNLGNKELRFYIENLKGIQKKIFEYVLDLCLANNEFTTGPINTSKMALDIGCSYGTAKTTINRLIGKLLIERLKGKSSSAGYICFTMDNKIKEMALEVRRTNRGGNWAGLILGNKLDNRSGNGLGSSSSSDLNNKETTTTGEWQNLDIEPLSSIGFTQTHIKQIASDGELTPVIVQDSIYAFAFDLEVNNKAKSIKGDPLNYFMGILRNGRPYAAPNNYESPKNRAMRLYVESKQKIENERKKMEEELFKVEFEEWQREQGTENLRNILPPELRDKGLLGEKASHWRAHFVQEVWPQKRKELIK